MVLIQGDVLKIPLCEHQNKMEVVTLLASLMVKHQRSSENNSGGSDFTGKGTPSEAAQTQSSFSNSIMSSGNDGDSRQSAEDTLTRASKQDGSGNVTRQIVGQTSQRSSRNNNGNLDFTREGTPSHWLVSTTLLRQIQSSSLSG